MGMKAEPSGEGLENLYIRVFQNYSTIAFGQTAIITKLHFPLKAQKESCRQSFHSSYQIMMNSTYVTKMI
jgi:hypothetical protein